MLIALEKCLLHIASVTRQSLSLAANRNDVDVNLDILEETGDIPAEVVSGVSTSANLMDY